MTGKEAGAYTAARDKLSNEVMEYTAWGAIVSPSQVWFGFCLFGLVGFFPSGYSTAVCQGWSIYSLSCLRAWHRLTDLLGSLPDQFSDQIPHAKMLLQMWSMLLHTLFPFYSRGTTLNSYNLSLSWYKFCFTKSNDSIMHISSYIYSFLIHL